MNRLKYILIAIIIFGFQNAFACSCVEEGSSLKEKVTSSFENKDLIFSGLVVAIENTSTGDIQSSMEPIIYTFEIVKNYKGVSKKKTIKVSSSQNGASCGYRFKMGQTYLVHANDFKEDFWTGLCTRNNVIRNVEKKELRILKRLKRRKKRASKH